MGIFYGVSGEEGWWFFAGVTYLLDTIEQSLSQWQHSHLDDICLSKKKREKERKTTFFVAVGVELSFLSCIGSGEVRLPTKDETVPFFSTENQKCISSQKKWRH
jgi:hypothetical protein